VVVLAGPQSEGQIEGMDLVIKSPGVPGEAPIVSAARRRQVPVWSEVELAYAVFANPFTAVTGTNGKTTTTALIGHMFEVAGRPARVLGNIGTAVTTVVADLDPGEELVVELSSFQLEDVDAFRPAAGVFLNLTQDHLDRHGTMERYFACKAKLFARQGPGDAAVLNVDDPRVAALAAELKAGEDGPQVLCFSTTGRGECEELGRAAAERGAGSRLASWLEDGWLVLGGRRAVAGYDLPLRGLHNMENCLAAATAALARGLPLDAVVEGLRTFPGVPHRLEPVGVVAGVAYVNDSKATNVEATLKALGAYPERTHLILGGRDKASDYRPVARACARGCVGVYVVGEAAPLMEAAFREVREAEGLASVPVPRVVGDLEGAVLAASAAAQSGDVVLLAPACASFDQYSCFEERGEHFAALVRGLSEERA